MTLDRPRLNEIARRLVEVDGVRGVALGGSRARGDAHPDSDVDLGLYYRAPLDTAGLRALAADLASARAGADAPELTEPGGWGPWVDGGGWLLIDHTPVDWIYRELDRVAQSVVDAHAGRLQTGFQVGHPFGVLSTAYAGELALGVLLADPSGELADLKARLDPYPAALQAAVVDSLWEARFLLDGARKSAGRGDTTMIAGVLFRVVISCAHVVHARAGKWAINEKGLVDAAGRLSTAPVHFVDHAHGVLSMLGRDSEGLVAALDRATALINSVS